MRVKLKRKISDVKYVVSNIGLLFSYSNDVKLLVEMDSSLDNQINGTSEFKLDVSNYNKVTLEFRNKYERINGIVLKGRLVEIVSFIVAIKYKKNELDRLVRSGKRKFIIDGKPYWARNRNAAYKKSLWVNR